MARMSNIKLIKYSALWQVGEWVGGKKEFDLPLYTLNYKTNMIFKDI
jgi:hypothetical protein